MNNLYRELAPITDAAWASIEEEARRTFGTYVAGRRIADVEGPGGSARAAVNTGHLGDVEPPAEGVIAHLREAQPLVRLRVPFRLNRTDIDDVRAGRAGLGLAAAEGRGQKDRLRRGPCGVRGIPGGRHHRAPGGDDQ